MTVKLSNETIKLISIFERITHVHAKDCIPVENVISFIVENNKVGAAVGKNGQNVKSLRNTLRKNIKIFGYGTTAEEFIKNVVPDVNDIELNNGTMVIRVDREKRSMIIGRGGENIHIIREILKRHFNINDLKLR